MANFLQAGMKITLFVDDFYILFQQITKISEGECKCLII